jgi:hypothetical protein
MIARWIAADITSAFLKLISITVIISYHPLCDKLKGTLELGLDAAIGGERKGAVADGLLVMFIE